MTMTDFLSVSPSLPRILSYVEYGDIANCRLVNKAFRDVIREKSKMMPRMYADMKIVTKQGEPWTLSDNITIELEVKGEKSLFVMSRTRVALMKCHSRSIEKHYRKNATPYEVNPLLPEDCIFQRPRDLSIDDYVTNGIENGLRFLLSFLFNRYYFNKIDIDSQTKTYRLVLEVLRESETRCPRIRRAIWPDYEGYSCTIDSMALQADICGRNFLSRSPFLARILSYVDHRDLLNCRLVSKGFRLAIQKNWKYMSRVFVHMKIKTMEGEETPDDIITIELQVNGVDSRFVISNTKVTTMTCSKCIVGHYRENATQFDQHPDKFNEYNSDGIHNGLRFLLSFLFTRYFFDSMELDVRTDTYDLILEEFLESETRCTRVKCGLWPGMDGYSPAIGILRSMSVCRYYNEEVEAEETASLWTKTTTSPKGLLKFLVNSRDLYECFSSIEDWNLDYEFRVSTERLTCPRDILKLLRKWYSGRINLGHIVFRVIDRNIDSFGECEELASDLNEWMECPHINYLDDDTIVTVIICRPIDNLLLRVYYNCDLGKIDIHELNQHIDNWKLI